MAITRAIAISPIGADVQDVAIGFVQEPLFARSVKRLRLKPSTEIELKY